MESIEIQYMSEYLKRNGYTPEELEKMDIKEMSKIYEERTREFIKSYNKALKAEISTSQEKSIEEQEITPDIIKAINENNSKIYEVLDEYFVIYTPHDIAELLVIGEKTTKMLRIKIREIQEFWLEQIEENLKNLPREEILNLMHYYHRQKENLKVLYKAYVQSSHPEYVKKIQLIADNKINLIKQYMPDEMEHNYKDFFNHSPAKLTLIDNILKLVKTNDKKYLLSLSMEELDDFYESLKQADEQERNEEKMVSFYIKTFQDALHNPDDQVFIDVCLEAAQNLPRKRFQELAVNLSNKHKAFRYRFNEVAKSHKDFDNLQVIL